MLGTGRPSEQDFNPGGLSEGGVIAFAFWRDYPPPKKKHKKLYQAQARRLGGLCGLYPGEV